MTTPLRSELIKLASEVPALREVLLPVLKAAAARQASAFDSKQLENLTRQLNYGMGKVKTKVQLDELEAEHYMDSVICGDVAYQVVEGFLGDLMAARPIGQAAAPAPAKAPEEEPSRKEVAQAAD